MNWWSYFFLGLVLGIAFTGWLVAILKTWWDLGNGS